MLICFIKNKSKKKIIYKIKNISLRKISYNKKDDYNEPEGSKNLNNEEDNKKSIYNKNDISFKIILFFFVKYRITQTIKN